MNFKHSKIVHHKVGLEMITMLIDIKFEMSENADAGLLSCNTVSLKKHPPPKKN